MTLALDILQQSLAAAEPRTQTGRVLVTPHTSYSWLLRTPYILPASVSDFVSEVFDAWGHREPELISATSDDTYVWTEVRGSATLMTAFRGADLRIDADVQTEKMLYVPKHGHIRVRYARDIEKLRATPGAVEYEGFACMNVNRSDFTKTLRILLRKGWIPDVRDVSMDVTVDTQDVISMQLFPTGNPRITDKMLPELEARMAVVKTKLQKRAADIMEFCAAFEPHKAVRAYKLLD